MSVRAGARGSRGSALALLCAAIVLGETRAHGDAAAPTGVALERKIKAAYLYKLTDYVEWPKEAFPRADTPLTIGILGDDRLAADLGRMVRERSVRGRPVEVKVFKDPPADGVHVVFVASEKSATLARLKRTPDSHALIVSESEGALAAGSMINFVIVEGHVRFEISLPAAERAGLSLSSRLLAVAQSVTTRSR